jgi:class 3 adenylate cyclase
MSYLKEIKMSDTRRTNTVLVVDDTPENIDLLDGVLNQDYKIKVALNGEKALKIAGSENPPDIILLDIEMPGMDGYEVCRRLKADLQTRDIPIIFVTAKSDESDETKGLEIGAVDYITKPFSPPIVKARVKTHLTLKMMRQRVEDAFGRHVHPSVAELILKGEINMDGEMKNVTLLFSDLRDFTNFAEQNQPQAVFTRINEYYSSMTEIIHRFDGVVLQYVGDEIEAVFGTPFPDDHHPDKAVQAALEMRQALAELNANLGQTRFHHGIGIHSGPVLAGVVGSKERQTYSLVGDTVNVASRVADLCKKHETDILVTHQTFQHLRQNYGLIALPSTQVKGRNQSLMVYRI